MATKDDMFEVPLSRLRELTAVGERLRAVERLLADRERELLDIKGPCSVGRCSRQAMGIDWMSRAGLSQALPPVYTEFLGEALLDHLGARQEIAA